MTNLNAENIKSYANERELGTIFAGSVNTKGNKMGSTRHAPAMNFSLISSQEVPTSTVDPGSVSYPVDNDAISCAASDNYCPMIEAFYDKQQKVDELQHKLDDADGRIRHLGDLAKLGELSAVVAHEIRNPLAGISATAEMLLDDIDAEDPRRESVRIILDEIQRLEKTVRNLLDFARTQKPFITRVDLREAMERVLARIDHHAKEHGVAINGICPNDLPDAQADPDLVRQAFLNVALNAIQAMPEGGELKVKLFRDADERGRCLRTAFIDTGCGIGKENLDRIFDPFFTTRANGAGLGLAVTRKIIEAQKGSVSVNSEVGRGSTFVITLPAAE